MSYRTDGQQPRTAADSEILCSAGVTIGSGLAGIILMVMGHLVIGALLMVVLFVGLGRAFSGNLLWRDLD